MVTTIVNVYKKVLRNYRSSKILNKIGAGRRIYFEDPLERIALRYMPGEIGKLSKYYVKPAGQSEYEIDSNSSFIIKAALHGNPISKARYDKYNFIEAIPWDLDILGTPSIIKIKGCIV